MSGQIRFTDEFKKDAVAQIVDRGYSVNDIGQHDRGSCAESIWQTVFQSNFQ